MDTEFVPDLAYLAELAAEEPEGGVKTLALDYLKQLDLPFARKHHVDATRAKRPFLQAANVARTAAEPSPEEEFWIYAKAVSAIRQGLAVDDREADNPYLHPELRRSLNRMGSMTDVRFAAAHRQKPPSTESLSVRGMVRQAQETEQAKQDALIFTLADAFVNTLIGESQAHIDSRTTAATPSSLTLRRPSLSPLHAATFSNDFFSRLEAGVDGFLAHVDEQIQSQFADAARQDGHAARVLRVALAHCAALVYRKFHSQRPALAASGAGTAAAASPAALTPSSVRQRAQPPPAQPPPIHDWSRAASLFDKLCAARALPYEDRRSVVAVFLANAEETNRVAAGASPAAGSPVASPAAGADAGLPAPALAPAADGSLRSLQQRRSTSRQLGRSRSRSPSGAVGRTVAALAASNALGSAAVQLLAELSGVVAEIEESSPVPGATTPADPAPSAPSAPSASSAALQAKANTQAQAQPRSARSRASARAPSPSPYRTRRK